jgi:hypothetical protein
MPDIKFVSASVRNHNGQTHAVPAEGLPPEYHWTTALCGVEVAVPVDKPDFRLGNPRKPLEEGYHSFQCKRCKKKIANLEKTDA